MPKFPKEYMAILAFISLFFISGCGCTRIEPGHIGIVVNLYGEDKGVSSYPVVTGMQWYNPISTNVFQYPTYVQTAVWTKDLHEGSPVNEEISFNSQEGLVITGDISLSYQLDALKAPSFYVKFRSDDLNHFTHGFLRNIARDAFNEVAPRYRVEEIYGLKKEEFLTTIRERINDQVKEFGVSIQQFGFIGAPRLPEAVVNALNSKIKATQDAQRVQNELQQTEAEAKKAVAKAEGEAKAKVAQAEGEAKANAALAKSITNELLEWRRLEISDKAIQKWSGTLPTYTGGSIPFIAIPQTAAPPTHKE